MKYETRSPDPDEHVRAWLAHDRTSDPRALAAGTHEDGSPARRYSCWDDRGEVHPFDNEGPDMWIDLKIPRGHYVLSFYHLDYDWYNGEHPRLMSVLLKDKRSGRPLSIVPPGRCGEGVYERFYVKGPRVITARVVKHRSACAVVSGIFLDPVPAWPEAPPWLEGQAEGLLGLRELYNADRAEFYRRVQPYFGATAGQFSGRDSPLAVWHRAWLHIASLRPESGTRLMHRYVQDKDGHWRTARAFAFALRNTWEDDRFLSANKWTFGRRVLEDSAEELLRYARRASAE